MKGLINILELLITGIILILAFFHFFPQYSIRTDWSSVLLGLSTKDVLNTIDRLNKTYDYSIDNDDGVINTGFEILMNKTFSPEYSGEPYVWWKEIHSLPNGINTTNIPYFTEAKKETIVDVIVIDGEFYVYTFSLGMGYPY